MIAGWALLGDFDCRKVTAGRFGIETDIADFFNAFGKFLFQARLVDFKDNDTFGQIDNDVGGEFFFGVELGFLRGAAADIDPATLEDLVGAFANGSADFNEAVVVGLVAEAKKGVFDYSWIRLE